MTTTARFPRPLPKSTDEMDLRSDDGIDFGDGDIDLDLDTIPPASTMPHEDDDDFAIADAASVNGHNVADDDMADNADYADVGYVHDENDAVMSTVDDSTTLTATAPAQDFSPAHVDAPPLTSAPANNSAPARGSTSPGYWMPPISNSPEDADLLDYSEDDPEPYTPAQGLQPGATSGKYNYRYLDVPEDNAGEAEVQSRANSHDSHLSEVHNDEHDEADREDGGDRLQNEGSLANDDEHENSDYGASLADNGHATTTTDAEHPHLESSDLQPVTVNYAGNELWLFKHHDTEETGDWLLEDISLASSSMSDLFRACRASLGDDVSNEHEIGLRFDHLHNLELYEDNTACVAVSIQRLVGLYNTLQEQDQNPEPEYFYCSLLFRPRFATLLSDIAKYAEQGSGYTGLITAVAAGETHFSNVISNASTEHEQTDWEEEQEEEVQPKGLGDLEAQQNVDANEYEEHDEQELHTGYEEVQDEQEDDDQGHDDAADTNVSHQMQVASADDASHEHAALSVISPNQQKSPSQLGTYTPRSQSKAEADAEAEARREKQEEEDLLEYSDDEEEPEEVQAVNTNGPSASSSTVQGDESATAEDSANTTGDHANNGLSGEHDEANLHRGEEGENQFNDQLLEGIDDTAKSYQHYDQAFGHDDMFQDFPAEGDANQNYDGFEYGALDQQLPLDFLDGAEFNAGAESAAAMNEFTETDDFLDLNNASDWVTDQAPTLDLADEHGTTQDDEDDAAQQPAAAVSSAAISVTASSTGANNASPQGQKRSVDEAGHGEGDALDSIDAKRPRV